MGITKKGSRNHESSNEKSNNEDSTAMVTKGIELTSTQVLLNAVSNTDEIFASDYHSFFQRGTLCNATSDDPPNDGVISYDKTMTMTTIGATGTRLTILTQTLQELKSTALMLMMMTPLLVTTRACPDYKNKLMVSVPVMTNLSHHSIGAMIGAAAVTITLL